MIPFPTYKTQRPPHYLRTDEEVTEWEIHLCMAHHSLITFSEDPTKQNLNGFFQYLSYLDTYCKADTITDKYSFIAQRFVTASVDLNFDQYSQCYKHFVELMLECLPNDHLAFFLDSLQIMSDLHLKKYFSQTTP